MSMQGKVAVVTGGSRGIGRAVCLELARRGANVVIGYAGDEQAAHVAADACRDAGGKAVIVKADIATAEGSEALFAEAVATFGRVDILVNNAGITRDMLILRMSEQDFDRVLDVNLKGAFFCMKLAARLMSKQRYGRIINMSSVVGLRGNAGQVNYAASKAGLIGMTKSLAKEIASRGVTVNAIAPGFIETDMTRTLLPTVQDSILTSIPLKRFGQPEEVAHAAAFLASEEAGYITGQVLCIDGGMAM